MQNNEPDREEIETSISDLPSDVLGHLVKKLPLIHALQLLVASPLFRPAVNEHYLPKVTSISLQGMGGKRATEAIVWMTTNEALGDIEDITLEGASVSESIEILLNCPRHVKTLKALALHEWKKLDGLRLCSIIEMLPALTSVTFENCQVGDEGLVAIAKTCPQLERLGAAHCRRITDDGVAKLAMGCRGLRSINLEGCVALTPLALAHLSFHCPLVGRVSVAKCFRMGANSPEGLMNPVALLGSSYSKDSNNNPPPLTHVSFSMCHRVSSIDSLGALSTLTSLDIIGCAGVKDSSLVAALKGSSSGLRVLNLSACTGLTGAGICAVLEQSSFVETLLLRGVGLKDHDLRGMALHISNLKEIDLSMASSVTDIGLEQVIKAAKDLEVLRMDGVFQATNRVLRLLRRHSRRTLRVLSVRMCNLITYDGLAGLVLGDAGMRSAEPEFEMRGWDDAEEEEEKIRKLGCSNLGLLIIGGSIEEAEMLMLATKIKFMTLSQGREVVVRW